MKIWEDDAPEPAEWDLTTRGLDDELRSGSVLLLAHHVDVTFGNVEIVPLP